jgi:hypothetical protein
MKRFALAILFISLIALAGCTDEPGARKALEDQGYTQIEFTGYRIWTCGEDYTYHTGFAAKSIAGKPVTGAVCSGFMKGKSIKVD